MLAVPSLADIRQGVMDLRQSGAIGNTLLAPKENSAPGLMSARSNGQASASPVVAVVRGRVTCVYTTKTHPDHYRYITGKLPIVKPICGRLNIFLGTLQR